MIKNLHVGIVGGGMAGSTVALRLAEQGMNVTLFEEGTTLVNGPPICHLHAGGNLYREISDEQCITLLRQSIDTLRVFPHTANIRPTVIAIPTHDNGNPEQLLSRLQKLQQEYAFLIEQDPKNKVLGAVDDYFKLYDQQTLEALARQDSPPKAQTLDDWMIPVAKNLNLNEFKLPLIIVQEYGLSIFRIAATVSLALEKFDSCAVLTQSKVTHIQHQEDNIGWEVCYTSAQNTQHTVKVDYLVNACGYRTGTLDDMPGFKRNRLVEFKAAYLVHWPDCKEEWPEVIFHGERGTPNGMAQLTPYPDGYFQLHGMTEDITLFKEGMAASSEHSAQPKLSSLFHRKLTDRWYQTEIEDRTEKAIKHVAQFIPNFSNAVVGGSPLFGAQQIPGDDPSLRAADVSFAGVNYARAEIVKASSALEVADAIIANLEQETSNTYCQESPQRFPVTSTLNADEVVSLAKKLANDRNFPTALARPFGCYLS